MNKIIFVILALLILSGCANRPFEPASNILEPKFTIQQPNSTKVRVHRIKQFTGSALGENCPLVLSVNDIETAGLQQNQYVDLYLPEGQHAIKVRFSCAFTAWSKSLTIMADGNYQEYETENGAVGQYRMWRTK